ncbi:MAG: zinc ribbon domain-containing protein [Candidatus Nanopelagicales bacterium]
MPEPVAPKRRGKSKGKNWRRPVDVGVSVIRLELDVSDPQARARVEKQWQAVYELRRALQRDARDRVDAYHAAYRERRGAGPKKVRERLGLSRKGIEAAASRHVDDSRWMRAHITKAVALHVADEVWNTIDRHLFPDTSGKRHGRPRVGGWWDFTRIPGRARSHTKTTKTWESWRLVGTLQGHFDAYGVDPGLTVAEAVLAPAGESLLAQPKQVPTPVAPIKNGRADWWGYDGPLTVVFTGLPGGDLVLPVRLPQGAGAFPRVAHYLADPSAWHKIDLVRVEDRRAPDRWRYYAHLMVLTPGYTADSTLARRAAAPVGRVGGVDGNVSNLAAVSMPSSPTEGPRDGLRADYVTVTDEQRRAAERAAKKARDRQRALDRSRRSANADQYHPSARQQARADRRAAAGLAPRTVDIPTGPRLSNAAGVPSRAYRKDTLTVAYRRTRADHAADARSAAQAKRARAAQAAANIVAAHGPVIVTEHVDVRAWARSWGRSIRVFSPGMLLAALRMECEKTGGALLRAATGPTALSQHCVCGRRERKPLTQRVHRCPGCGLVADRDLLAAALAACVTLTDPDDPTTARIDPELLAALARRAAAQQEALHRSTAPAPGPSTPGGRDGSHHPVAPAGDHVEGTGPHPGTAPGPTQGHGRRRRTRPRTTNRPDLRVNS